MNLAKCVFLDRDGVLNEELGFQITDLKDFRLKQGVGGFLRSLKDAGYLLIVVTNQSGIAKGSYTEAFVYECHAIVQHACGGIIDALYFAPGHESVSKSLLRKPDSLMFEKAIAKFGIDPTQSWMIGDKERDLIPAKKLGVGTIHLTDKQASEYADFKVSDLVEAAAVILNDE
ncbi:MAG: HAD-IIIA family hydrolase [Bacteroidota bacterium]|nr:HAD-IIIA family hydrolase [Bacteroidota bacterium]